MEHNSHIELDADTSSVRRARDFVRAALAAWELDDLSEVALLLTSELVTNTVLHARTAFDLSVAFERPELTVEVRDGSPDQPAAAEVRIDDERGRGLVLLSALAARWGVRIVDGGKAVWFSLVSEGGEAALSGSPDTL